MKYLIILVAALFLTACQTPAPISDSTSPNAPNVIDAKAAGGKAIDPAKLSLLGETCGPISDKICGSGLSCQFQGLDQNAGLCLPTVVNADLECSEEQLPVCGLLGNNKNGYLNECFARRYGAVVVGTGFCKPDLTIVNNCEARAYSLGNCQESFNGAYLNAESGECETVTLVGCGADIPFESLEACESSCS